LYFSQSGVVSDTESFFSLTEVHSMAHFSVIVIAHDELDALVQDPDLGKQIQHAVLRFATHQGDGAVVVNTSTSVMRVVSSFNSNDAPKVLVTGEGWHWYDSTYNTVPSYLQKYLKARK
jgi:hypothetical protein